MEKVLGIGGIFVRARDRQTLACWYRDHLGLDVNEQWWGAILPLKSDRDRPGAYAVWSAFPADTDYFGGPSQAFMVNFRVHDLEAMLSQLRAAGCHVDDRVEKSDFGSFGWVTDPEGNRIELWQPPEKAPVG